MTSDELYDAFRSDVVDTAKPYLWSDDEVFRYMGDAHRMFVRLIGGIADVTSDACKVDIVTGEAEAALHPSILRIMSARRLSDNGKIKVVNETDLPLLSEADYGRFSAVEIDDTPGAVRYMLIGQQEDLCRWIRVPEADDTALLSIYRLPLVVVSGPGQEISEVKEDHHMHMLDWMEHLAYKKQDAETFDKSKSEAKKSDFMTYCSFVKSENERKMYKTRVVQYGGI